MAEVSGVQLALIQKLYGLSANQLAGVTQMDADNVQQVVPIVPEILRRSLNIVGNNEGGLFQGVMENVHSAADSEVSTYRPYEGVVAGSTTIVGGAPGFPLPVPTGWDLWLLGMSLSRTSGAGTVVAMLALNGDQLGWGIDDAGAAVTSTPNFHVARFTSIVADAAGEAYGIDAQGNPFVNINKRLPRSMTLQLHSTSDAAATIQASLLMGIFPESMGQDVVT